MSSSNTPNFQTEANLAGRYPDRRFGQRERKILESVQNAFPFSAVIVGTASTTAGASQTLSVSGVLATDAVLVSVKTAGATPRSIVAASAGTNSISVTMSGDPSTDHVLQYVVIRSQS